MQGYRLLKLGYEYVRKSLSAQLPDSRKRGEAAKKKEEAKRKRRNAIVR